MCIYVATMLQETKNTIYIYIYISNWIIRYIFIYSSDAVNVNLMLICAKSSKMWLFIVNMP